MIRESFQKPATIEILPDLEATEVNRNFDFLNNLRTHSPKCMDLVLILKFDFHIKFIILDSYHK